MEEKKSYASEGQEEITRKGNPRKPQGEEGFSMLRRMNESHGPVTEWALGFLNFQENDRALDIGCGGGATLQRISKRIGKGHLTGVDYSPVSVGTLEKTNRKDIAGWKDGDRELPWKNCLSDSSFDKIVTVESFYFWPDPEENLKEVYRVLAEDGTFLLVADIYQKEGLTREVLENIERYQLYNPTPEHFRELFETAGFAEIAVHTEEGTDWICVEGRKITEK